MKRAAVATATAVGIALAFAHPWDAQREPARVFLPHVSQRQPRPAATAVPRPTYRPASAGALIDALTVPGALVLPEPGVYHLPVQARVAAGVTLNGRGLVEDGGTVGARWVGNVTITGRGLMVEDAAGVTLRGVSVRGVKGDGATATRAHGLVVEHAAFSLATDGLFDLNGGSTVTMRDVLFTEGSPRGQLCGNWQSPWDGRERLVMDRVTFRDVPVRTPKLQDCDLVARSLVIVRAKEWGLDLRGSSTADLRGLLIVYGPKTNRPGWRADDGSTVMIDGEVVDR